MSGILQNLWLIPMLRLLAAGISALAHGSVGDYTFAK